MTGTPARGIAIPWIAAALIGLFAFDNILLGAFLGKLTPFVAILGAGGILLLLTLLVRAEPRHAAVDRISVATLLTCFAIAACLFVVGGEGRFLYANFDWQVRDAVLGDMGHNPWPFAYAVDGTAYVLRAPVGMYLVPALLGGVSQTARDLALLASNSVMLGLLLALGGSLFERRSRWIALLVFVLFSGLDIVGTQIVVSNGGYASFDHLERWMAMMQYSSAITQILWVPQHAMAGWAAAVLYLLWRREMLSPAFLISVIPLSALWSPLALLGTIPFALFAGIRLTVARKLSASLIGVAVVSVIIAAPGLLYLTTDAGKVVSGFQAFALLHYVLFILFEVGLYLLLVWSRRAEVALDKASFAIVAGSLLLMPLYHIGSGEDFMMRASIMPLALLAYFVAQCVTLDYRASRSRIALMLVLAFGAVTGLKEVTRAVRNQPAPPPQCTLVDVWTQQGERIEPINIYVARATALPAFIQPRTPALVQPSKDHKPCWKRPWVTPR
jgi:hypothetical protein